MAGAEPGLGRLFSPRHLALALVVYHSSVSLLPAFFMLSLEGSTDLSKASKARPSGLGFGMGSSFSSLSSEA